MKGFTLLHLITVLTIIGILIVIPIQTYNTYLIKSKITALLTGVGNKKIEIVENIRKIQKVTQNHRIIIDTKHIVPESKLVLLPMVIEDQVYWGCNKIGLTNQQSPDFCNLNDFTSPQANINTELNCGITQGVVYDNITKKFNVRVIVEGEIITVGDFSDIEQAANSYLEMLDLPL